MEEQARLAVEAQRDAQKEARLEKRDEEMIHRREQATRRREMVSSFFLNILRTTFTYSLFPYRVIYRSDEHAKKVDDLR